MSLLNQSFESQLNTERDNSLKLKEKNKQLEKKLGKDIYVNGLDECYIIFEKKIKHLINDFKQQQRRTIQATSSSKGNKRGSSKSKQGSEKERNQSIAKSPSTRNGDPKTLQKMAKGSPSMYFTLDKNKRSSADKNLGKLKQQLQLEIQLDNCKENVMDQNTTIVVGDQGSITQINSNLNDMKTVDTKENNGGIHGGLVHQRAGNREGATIFTEGSSSPDAELLYQNQVYFDEMEYLKTQLMSLKKDKQDLEERNHRNEIKLKLMSRKLKDKRDIVTMLQEEMIQIHNENKMLLDQKRTLQQRENRAAAATQGDSIDMQLKSV